MDVDSTISSGRSTPAMMNGQGSTTSSSKNIAYNCCWDQCQACFNSSPDLADHIRSIHVDGQRGGVGFVISFFHSLFSLVLLIYNCQVGFFSQSNLGLFLQRLYFFHNFFLLFISHILDGIKQRIYYVLDFNLPLEEIRLSKIQQEEIQFSKIQW